jgi:hypothetical protein
LLAAVLPSVGREPLYREDHSGEKAALMMMLGHRGFTRIGEFRELFREERLLTALHVAHGLLVSPRSLALFLQAAPREALELAGKFAAVGLAEVER